MNPTLTLTESEMLAALYGFFGILFENMGKALTAIFSFLKSEKDGNKATFDAVIKTQGEIIVSMRERIDVMDSEFKKAMTRRDVEQERTDKRIVALEEENEECRKRLGNAMSQVAELRGKVKALMSLKEEGEKIKALKEDPQYQHDTIVQAKTLLEYQAQKPTQVEQNENPTR